MLVLAAVLSVYLLPVLWLAWPAGRRRLAVLFGALAVGMVVWGVVQAGATAELKVTHLAPGYEGKSVIQQPFPVAEASAPGWGWPVLLAVGFAVLAGLGWRGDPARSEPFREGLLLAIGAVALQLGLQKLAAPAALALGPLHPPAQPSEPLLVPLTIVAAMRIGWREVRFRTALLRIFLLVSLTRIPLAIAGSWLTQNQLGTWLDVHRITFFVVPLGEMPIDTTAGSQDQLMWLVWVPQLVLFPLVTILAAGGLGFMTHMFRKGKEAAAR